MHIGVNVQKLQCHDCCQVQTGQPGMQPAQLLQGCTFASNDPEVTACALGPQRMASLSAVGQKHSTHRASIQVFQRPRPPSTPIPPQVLSTLAKPQVYPGQDRQRKEHSMHFMPQTV